MSSLRQRINAVFKGIYTARPTLSIKDWARNNIKLSTKESGDFPGSYDPDLNPLPTILFDVYQSGEYRKAVFKKSSQSGVTLVVLILICYYITYVARNFLYMIDSRDEMRRVSKERLQPMLKTCGAAAGKISENEDDLTNLTLSLKGLTGYLCGSNSEATYANKSVGLAVNDECDTYAKKNAVALTADRGKKQTGFFQILLSKPENWEDICTQEYLRGTRHRPFYPCPHCGTRQTVDWSRIRFDHCTDLIGNWDYERMAKEIYLRCVNPQCVNPDYAHIEKGDKGRIMESSKAFMLTALPIKELYQQTNFGEDEYKPVPGVFSCEIDDLMSMFPTATWTDLAREWNDAQGDEVKLKAFLRGRLAQGWKQKKIEVGDSDIYRMSAAYQRGHCPVEPRYVLMASDKQLNLYKWVKTGWTNNGDCYVIDWGECLSAAELLHIADDPVIVDKWNEDTPSEKRVNPVVYKGMVDEGYMQDEVRDFVVSTCLGRNVDGSFNYRFYSCWGQGGIHSRSLRDLVVPVYGDKPNAIHRGYPIYAYRFSDDNFKDQLYNKRFGGFKEFEAAIKAGKPAPNKPRVFFPAHLEPAFVRELCQEKFTWSEKNKRWEWIEPKEKNDFGDALKMNFVGFYILAPGLALKQMQEQQAQEQREKPFNSVVLQS
jgi:phage terminase large subunit GpA-like protein